MSKTNKLVEILDRLNSGENPEAVKAEARQFLAGIAPADLSLAEQKLMERGLSLEDFGGLCRVHLEMLGEDLQRMKASLPPGHVIHTLLAEHERIVEFLDELERVNRRIQAMDRYDAGDEDFASLRHIAEHLVGAEPHHQREEEVLFPELEKRGITGPPRVMRYEHQQLRPRKHELAELAEKVPAMDFGDFRRRLAANVAFLAPTLREHIQKENSILYPTAVQVITDPAVWEKMRQQCDRIGYCCFTPSSAG